MVFIQEQLGVMAERFHFVAWVWAAMLDAEGLWMTIYLDNEGGLFYFSNIVCCVLWLSIF
jgi:hypothetical protein